MNGKSKTLGLGMLVAVAVAAIAAASASATYSGHFVSEAKTTTVIGTESTTHRAKFSVGGGTPVECEKVSYQGLIGAETVAGFTVTPKYETCKTEGSASHNVTIAMNECDYTFKSTSETHGTFEFLCRGKGPIKITHPNCTITIPEKTQLSGVSYATTVEEGKHALTVNFTVKNIPAQYHTGVCTILGTNQLAELKGSITLRGTDEAGKPVHITNT